MMEDEKGYSQELWEKMAELGWLGLSFPEEYGRIGFTWDHNMHLYFKRAKASEVNFGDGDYHREIIARLLKI
jgi:alkylation response protein AidB-like acyl-CoA dehydrogenase